MKPDQFTLDYIAENVLEADESWEASRWLGKRLVAHMRSDKCLDADRFYRIEDEEVDQELLGVSEQPDLSGKLIVGLCKNVGQWGLSRPETRSYHELQQIPKQNASFIGLQVDHFATYQPLLRVALPITPISGHVLRRGASSSYTSNAQQKGMFDRYNAGDVVFEPRRVQVAAYVMRHIFENSIQPGSPSHMSPEQELAFLDKHLPYQDLPLTGGGGKTVRRRHIRDSKRQTYTLAELQAMNRPRSKREQRDE